MGGRLFNKENLRNPNQQRSYSGGRRRLISSRSFLGSGNQEETHLMNLTSREANKMKARGLALLGCHLLAAHIIEREATLRNRLRHMLIADGRIYSRKANNLMNI
jgi:hypothetical protein